MMEKPLCNLIHLAYSHKLNITTDSNLISKKARDLKPLAFV